MRLAKRLSEKPEDGLRSGESVELATRFDSGVLGVWGDLAYHGDQLSGRLIYRLLQKLRPVLATVVDAQAALS